MHIRREKKMGCLWQIWTVVLLFHQNLQISSSSSVGWVECDWASYCHDNETCCCVEWADKVCFLWKCCPVPSAICCSDRKHCCPPQYPICDNNAHCWQVRIMSPFFFLFKLIFIFHNNIL